MVLNKNQESSSLFPNKIGIAKDKLLVKLGNEDDVIDRKFRDVINSKRTDPIEEVISELKERLEDVVGKTFSEKKLGLIWILKSGELAENHLREAEEKYNSEELSDEGLIEMREEAVTAERIFDRALSVAQAYSLDELDSEEVSLNRITVDGEKLSEEVFENEIESRISSFHQKSEKAEQIYRKAEQQLNDIPEF